MMFEYWITTSLITFLLLLPVPIKNAAGTPVWLNLLATSVIAAVFGVVLWPMVIIYWFTYRRKWHGRN